MEKIIEEMKIKALKAAYDLVGGKELIKEEKWDIYKYLTILHSKDMNKILEVKNGSII